VCPHVELAVTGRSLREVDWGSPESVLSMSRPVAKQRETATPPIRSLPQRRGAAPRPRRTATTNSVKQPGHFLPHAKCSRNDGHVLLAPVLDIFDRRVLGMRREMSRTPPRNESHPAANEGR
jgi:hypothetical protein